MLFCLVVLLLLMNMKLFGIVCRNVLKFFEIIIGCMLVCIVLVFVMCVVVCMVVLIYFGEFIVGVNLCVYLNV